MGANGTIEYLGTCTNRRPYVEAADCIVLPSYREGLPRVLVEAAAMGRPAIASDAPGCGHAVAEEVTGFLCRVRSSGALAEAIIRFIALTQAERQEMELNARAHAEGAFWRRASLD